MEQLKGIVKLDNEVALTQYLHSFSVGFAAHQFIEAMKMPNQRVEFLVAIAKTYPDDWKQAVEMLGR